MAGSVRVRGRKQRGVGPVKQVSSGPHHQGIAGQAAVNMRVMVQRGTEASGVPTWTNKEVILTLATPAMDLKRNTHMEGGRGGGPTVDERSRSAAILTDNADAVMAAEV